MELNASARSPFSRSTLLARVIFARLHIEN